MLEVAATTPSNPLVGGRVVDISLLTNDAAGPNSAAGRPRIAAGTPLTRAARPGTVTLFYTPIERAIPKAVGVMPKHLAPAPQAADRLQSFDVRGARLA